MGNNKDLIGEEMVDDPYIDDLEDDREEDGTEDDREEDDSEDDVDYNFKTEPDRGEPEDVSYDELLDKCEQFEIMAENGPEIPNKMTEIPQIEGVGQVHSSKIVKKGSIKKTKKKVAV